MLYAADFADYAIDTLVSRACCFFAVVTRFFAAIDIDIICHIRQAIIHFFAAAAFLHIRVLAFIPCLPAIEDFTARPSPDHRLPPARLPPPSPD